MSNNKQIEKHLELPHQETVVGINTIQTKPFDNQKITKMSNNKQSSIDILLKELEEIGVLNIKNCHWSDEVDVKKAIEQAKAMHHKEVVDFVEDWYCNGPLLGGGVDVVATIEEHYTETFGGNK